MKPLLYLSVCSGIEAATVAWHGLGWTPVAFAEIEAFPSAALSHHYPAVPNLGDMTRYLDWPMNLLATVDILVGGTPCQAFSVAGARGSLGDERGNLTLIYAHLLDRIDSARALHGRPPALCLWENVPGVLNTADNALGCFLGLLAGEDDALSPPGGRWTDAGYVRGPGRAVAWRCLDAQYLGLAQRRQRVFLVASAGAVRPEEILFECQGLRRDTPPSRRKGEGTAGTLSARSQGGGGLGTDFELGGGLVAEGKITPPITGAPYGDNSSREGMLIPETTGPLCSNGKAAGSATGQDAENGMLIPHCMSTGQAGAEIGIGIGIGTTLNCNHEAPIVAFSSKDHGADAGELSPTLRSMGHDGSHANGGGQVAIAFKASHFTRGKDGAPSDLAAPLSAEADKGDQDQLVIPFSSRARGDDCRGYDRAPQIFGDAVGAIDTVKPHCVATGFRSSGNCSAWETGDKMDALTTGTDPTSHAVVIPAVAFNLRGREGGAMPEVDESELAVQRAASGESSRTYVAQPMAVRRLTPRECERLQGFPDDYTLFSYRGKPASDGPRYKALGNSMAVPVMRWIGQRISSLNP